MNILQSELLNNTTTGNGGALLFINGQAHIEATTLADNHANGTGGAIRANNGTLDLVNSTISGNSATNGGAFYITNAGVTLTNTTLTGNSGDSLAQAGTGAIHAGNTIIANSTSGYDCASGLHLVSDGHNLASDGSCTSLTAAGDLTDTDPLLGPLADNGGPTETNALLSGSPAIDADDNAICAADLVNNLDQRGITRPQGPACDIGAFEKTIYNFSGFFSPIDNPPAVNQVKAGQAIPVKFSLGGDFGLDIFAAGYPVSQKINCDSSSPEGDIEATSPAGNSSLSYDPDSDQYNYKWKTDKGWKNTCRQLIVRFDDGSEYTALFQFK